MLDQNPMKKELSPLRGKFLSFQKKVNFLTWLRKIDISPEKRNQNKKTVCKFEISVKFCTPFILV
jgi:hypothetical protein